MVRNPRYAERAIYWAQVTGKGRDTARVGWAPGVRQVADRPQRGTDQTAAAQSGGREGVTESDVEAELDDVAVLRC
jgi:hypothetical protein